MKCVGVVNEEFGDIQCMKGFGVELECFVKIACD
jgi:hypothetical protein